MSYSLSVKFLPIKNTKEEVYNSVDQVLQVIINSGLSYKVGPSETTVNGTFDELNNILININKTAINEQHKSFMILANFTYSQYEQDIEEKTKKYEV